LVIVVLSLIAIALRIVEPVDVVVRVLVDVVEKRLAPHHF
jgi:hypothetical protein